MRKQLNAISKLYACAQKEHTTLKNSIPNNQFLLTDVKATPKSLRDK